MARENELMLFAREAKKDEFKLQELKVKVSEAETLCKNTDNYLSEFRGKLLEALYNAFAGNADLIMAVPPDELHAAVTNASSTLVYIDEEIDESSFTMYVKFTNERGSTYLPGGVQGEHATA